MKPTASATVFHVKNLQTALEFYVSVLGFKKEFSHQDLYASVEFGPVSIHLSAHDVNQKPPGSGHIYIFCDEVDEYFASITAKGAKARSSPKDYDYGMRDFEIEIRTVIF